MALNIFKLIFGPRQRDYVPVMPELKPLELADVQRAYARLFATEDGRKVIDHLQRTAFMKACAADAGNDALRYQEGQRGLVALILRHILAGRQG